MLWTLYGYITKDLLINFSLSLVGLTTVLALGGVLVRMRQEGLDSTRIVLLFFYLVPVMLTITLPFASLFSATLVYGRMSSMNEINACRAGGISLARLMYPALVLAVLTGMASTWLAMYAIPKYTREVEVMLRRDIKRVLMAKLRSRGMAIMPGAGYGSLIIADWADPGADRPLMRGVTTLLKQTTGDIQLVASDAMEMDYDPETNLLKMRLNNPWGAPYLRQYEAEWMTLQAPAPSQFYEKVKFRNFEGLLALRETPVDDPDVKSAIRHIIHTHYFHQFYELMERSFGGAGRPGRMDFSGIPPLRRLSGETSLPDRFRVTTPHRFEVVPGVGHVQLRDVVVELFQAGYEQSPPGSPRYLRYKAGLAFLEPVIDFNTDRSRLVLRLTGCSDAVERVGSELQQLTVRSGTALFDSIEMMPRPPSFATLDFRDIYKHELPKLPDIEMFNSRKETIERSIQNVLLNIDAELHCRFAMGVCCLLFVFLGAGLGVLCRTGDYVLALAVSAAPGAITLGVIVMGRRVLIDMRSDIIGVLVIWGGPILLLLANLILYRSLLRR